MALDGQADRLERQYEGLLISYGEIMQSIARLDERTDVGERERREIREGLVSLASEMRSGLAEFDKSCARKVDGLAVKMEDSAKETRKDIKGEIQTQVGLQIASAEKAREWSPAAKATVLASAITAVGAVLIAVLT